MVVHVQFDLAAGVGGEAMAGVLIPVPFPQAKKSNYNFVPQKKVVDYYAAAVKTLENRLWQRDKRDKPLIQPDLTYYNELDLPCGVQESPVYSVTTKFVRASANKTRCPIYCISWVPDGRRLITGAASGEFTLWNGINLNFESILQGHDCSVRSMTWSHNGMWMTSTDDRGYIKYWQANLNNVHTFQAHNDPVRSSSFSPTDTKLATCSEDGTVRTFDFIRCAEEFILRGHGADVMSVDWHPRKSLLASGSKDNQQPVKLWDPKAGQSVATIHAHKATVQCVSWNRNGNWLLTAARDTLIKVFDIRNMKEIHTLKGHKKDVNTVAWHPVHESLFASGGGDGSILFWTIGNEREIGGMESAHDSFIWNLCWHPLGHILVSCSSDHTSKFWCRNRPGEEMRDKYNTASALITEDTGEENYSFPSIGGPLHIGGAGSSMKHDAIHLPPPSWGSQHGPGLKGQDASAQQDSKDITAKHNVPLLGADIIAEQFGDKPKPGPAPPGSQGTPTHPTSPQFGFPPQRLFDEQGRPPPSENMNFQRPDHDRGGMPPQGGPPPPDHFRHPPQDQQREWQGRGPPPPPGREFVRPEFRGGPPPGPAGEFNRPSPYSWQRSVAGSFRERRPSHEEHRFPPQENPYVYRRPEAEMQRGDPRDPRRADWREGPHPPPRRGQPWEEGHGGSSGPPLPPHTRGPPMREEFPDNRAPPQSGPRRPPEEFERRGGDFPPRESFDHRGGGGAAFPPRPGPHGKEPPPQPQPQQQQQQQQQQQGRVIAPPPGQQGQPREMWGERGPPHGPPPSSQHQQPQQQAPRQQQQPGQLPPRQPPGGTSAAPLDPRGQGRLPPSMAERQGQPPPQERGGRQGGPPPPNEQQRREFPHRPPPSEQHGGPPRGDQPRLPPHGMPHPPRSEAQGPAHPQRFNEPRPPRGEAQGPAPQRFNEPRLPPRSEAQGLPPQRFNEPRPPTSEAQRPSPHQPPFGDQRPVVVSPHQPRPPAPGPSEVFFQQKQQPPPHTPPQAPPQAPPQGQPRFQGPPPPGGVRPPPPQQGAAAGMRMKAPPNQQQRFLPPPPHHHDRQGNPPQHERQGLPPQHDRQGHPPQHERTGPSQHERQGPPQRDRQGHPPQHERQGPPPPQRDRQGPPPQHDRQGPPHQRQGPPPPHDRQGHPPQFQPPPHQQPQQLFRGGPPPHNAPPTSGHGQQPPRHPTPADPRMNRPAEQQQQQPPQVQHHQPSPPGRGGQFGGPPPPHNHPLGHRGQAPPPGHMPQQGPAPPHWRGPGGMPPPPGQGAGGQGYREGPPGGGGDEHFDHSRDPRDRRREERERSPGHRRSSNDRDVPPSKRSRLDEKDDRSRPGRPKRD